MSQALSARKDTNAVSSHTHSVDAVALVSFVALSRPTEDPMIMQGKASHSSPATGPPQYVRDVRRQLIGC